ncbi:DUF4390 domain-containing protein [Pseudorhodoferax sp.]|uniref:DUF4390 domain-containing protein n=1 Tax=Pseudorhodoferax sp. TaxID=1993553 RepID=UPI0039E5BD85
MTVSFTACWRRARLSVCRALLALQLLALGGAVDAQAPAPGKAVITELQLQRVDGALELTAQVQFELPHPVEDAMLKGIPMYFVAEAEILRERWYWTDERIVGVSRHMRLAYQPLTRRWRLNVGPRPIDSSGQGVTLAQTFDALPEALASVQRIARWHIADAASIPTDREHLLRFRFGLDVSQLPRPFQIGAVGESEWELSVGASVRIPPVGAR